MLTTVGIGLIGFITLSQRLPFFFGFIPLGIAYPIARQAYRSVPEMFTLLPRAPKEMAGGPGPTVAAERLSWPVDTGREVKPDWRRMLDIGRIVWRTLYDRWSRQFLLAAPWIFIFGMLLQGSFFQDDELRFSQLFLATYLLFTFSRLVIRRVSRLDHLPISRRMIFAIMTLPFLLCLVSGYLTGYICHSLDKESGEIIYFQDSPGQSPGALEGITLLPQYFEIALDGNIAEIVSPWGETATPRRLELIKGLPVAIYKPYTTDRASTREFIAWQLRRAVKKVYGDSIPAAELSDTYLTNSDPVGSKAGGLTIAADYPSLSLTPGGHLSPFIFLLVAGGALVTQKINFNIMRGCSSRKKVTAAFITSLVVLLGLHMGQYILDMLNVLDLTAITSFYQILIRAIYTALPAAVILIWSVSILLTGLIYWWAERSFCNVESIYVDVNQSSCWWRVTD